MLLPCYCHATEADLNLLFKEEEEEKRASKLLLFMDFCFCNLDNDAFCGMEF